MGASMLTSSSISPQRTTYLLCIAMIALLGSGAPSCAEPKRDFNRGEGEGGGGGTTDPSRDPSSGDGDTDREDPTGDGNGDGDGDGDPTTGTPDEPECDEGDERDCNDCGVQVCNADAASATVSRRDWPFAVTRRATSSSATRRAIGSISRATTAIQIVVRSAA